MNLDLKSIDFDGLLDGPIVWGHSGFVTSSTTITPKQFVSEVQTLGITLDRLVEDLQSLEQHCVSLAGLKSDQGHRLSLLVSKIENVVETNKKIDSYCLDIQSKQSNLIKLLPERNAIVSRLLKALSDLQQTSSWVKTYISRASDRLALIQPRYAQYLGLVREILSVAKAEKSRVNYLDSLLSSRASEFDLIFVSSIEDRASAAEIRRTMLKSYNAIYQVKERIEPLVRRATAIQTDLDALNTISLYLDRQLTLISKLSQTLDSSMYRTEFRVYGLECTARNARNQLDLIYGVMQSIEQDTSRVKLALTTGSFVGAGKNIRITRKQGRLQVHAYAPELPPCPYIPPPPPPPIIKISSATPWGNDCAAMDSINPPVVETPKPDSDIKPCGVRIRAVSDQAYWASKGASESDRQRITTLLAQIDEDRKTNGRTGCIIIGNKPSVYGAGADYRLRWSACYGPNSYDKVIEYFTLAKKNLGLLYPSAMLSEGPWQPYDLKGAENCTIFGEEFSQPDVSGSGVVEWSNSTKDIKTSSVFSQMKPISIAGWT